MVVVHALASGDPLSFFNSYTDESNVSVSKCTATKNSSTLLSYNAKNGGIPWVLGVNVALWAGMIIGFCVLRRLAWNYARLGLIQKKQHWATSVYRQAQNNDVERTPTPGSENSDVVVVEEEGYIRWIWTTITLSHEAVTSACGQDAGHYLSFMRHLVMLQVIITVLSTAVILPANYSGALEKEGFARTTVTNLDKDSNVYWLHNVFSVLYMVIVIVVMTLFARQLRQKRQSESFHTLMITQVPGFVTEEEITTHFEEAYSSVVDVQFAYDISKLSKLNKQRTQAVRAHAKYKELSEIKGSAVMIHKGVGGGKLAGCCCGDKVEGEAFYQDRVHQLTEQRSSAQPQAMRKRLDIAFVTLSDSAIAERVKLDYSLGRKPASSSLSEQVRSSQWSVELAPLPDNLKWKNLATGTFLWWARFVLINACLGTVLFFWTTPVVIISSLGNIQPDGVSEAVASNSLLTIWLPTTLLWLVTALLPVAVSYTTHFEKHWTKSDLELYIMRKTFMFLMLMALVLPSLGLASLDSFFTHFNSKTAVFNQLECIFLPNNGGFFISYVTFCAFIGTGIDLLRLPQLATYLIAVKRAQTKREKEEARKAITGQFQFGVEYAWVITIFGMCLVFSITCPLIAVFGLAYLILKYFIDKYNLYFALGRAHRVVKINVHHTAVNFVILCAVLLQLTDLFFSLLRLRKLDSHTIFALVMLILSVLYVASSMIFGQLAYLTPFRQRLETRNDEELCLPKGSYVAPVLRPTSESPDGIDYTLWSEDDEDEEIVGTKEDLAVPAPQQSRQQTSAKGYQTFD